MCTELAADPAVAESAPEPRFEASPLGAHWDGEAVSFRLYSRRATGVELCLFDHSSSSLESRRLSLQRAGDEWHVRVPGIGPGQLYGYRVHGPYRPQDGCRFNPSKLLVDPYARAMTGEPHHHPWLFGFQPGQNPDLGYCSADSAPFAAKCIVVDPAFDWQGDRPPAVPWEQTVIYEAQIKGLTRLHPGLPPDRRGTYLGLAAEPVIAHLQDLGITTLQLLPVFQSASEAHLWEHGLRNYWGYSTLGYFAPNAGYATSGLGQQVGEFKTMVRELHRAGIEVILDVVYNHTAEGGAGGPLLSFKGLDCASYYRLRPHDRSRFVDYTGCGNTLDVGLEPVRRLILDSLRYWVQEMHVDGFRYDLAPSLGREAGDFRPQGGLLQSIVEDPVLSRVKHIAEPWDLGPGGYQLGRFPRPWAEWNDRFRDGARRFWRGEAHPPELAQRLGGSPDLFAEGHGTPSASINFVTCHDGFTLQDLVSYERKHNQANGEDNRDGSDHNLSRNWGVEGPSDDPELLMLRDRNRRNLLATLLLARGVPMLAHGDELGRSQGGNNNAYCQDNETSWLRWDPENDGGETLAYVRRLTALRREHAALRVEGFIGLDGAAPSWRWLDIDGRPLDGSEPWRQLAHPAFALWFPEHLEERLLWLVNGSEETVRFELPSPVIAWRELLNTERWQPRAQPRQGSMTMVGHSLALLLAEK